MPTGNALLRNINPSGALFTENILLKLRDNPESLKIGQIDSFVNEKEGKSRDWIKKHREKVFEWGKQKWDEIEPVIQNWETNELMSKWLIPFFEQLGHEIEDFKISDEDFDEDSALKNFRISHQSKGHKDPFFHLVGIADGFDSKIQKNPKNLTHHGICQQFVNLNPEINWLILSNGRILRLITKYFYSYSQGYLEFDLENIFAKRDTKEFNLLYAIISLNRFISVNNNPPIIDELKEESNKEGIKVGDDLRDNVHDALELLGNKLIQQNPDLLEKINDDKLNIQEFYAELLRIIYRIIFILYAEQRDMLPGSDSLYFKSFSLSSLRILAEKPIKPEINFDLWNKLFLTFSLLQLGNDYLQVPCFNGSLFNNALLPIIVHEKEILRLSNDVVLKIIRLLTTSKRGNLTQRVNFLEVSEEEIGAIYESLLDNFPYITPNYHFELRYQTTERKGTGSYYTKPSLIDILIKTTLEPLVKERLEQCGDSQNEQEKAILDLKICDPACGGGTFLLSALDYLGEVLAFIRDRESNPNEDELRQARRDILQNCIYGVDKNPLAVELAKISLWLRACVNNKPLNYLDNHIKCGNSLIGLGKKPENLLIKPDFYKAIGGNKQTGIDKENSILQNKARNQIKKELQSLGKHSKTKITYLTSYISDEKIPNIDSEAFQNIIRMSEDNIESILLKEQRYKNLRTEEKFINVYNEANLWASSFFWPLDGEILSNYPNNTVIGEIRANISNENILKTIHKSNHIAKDRKFFHWYLEFPEVFSTNRNGFDLILSNPPWEILQLKESEFFISLDEILNATNQSERRKLIKNLKIINYSIFNQYVKAWRNQKKTSNYFSNSGIFELTAKGTLNTYALFAERCLNLISKEGYCGIITPTGIVMNYYMQDFFRELVNGNSIISMFDFENKKKLFDIHSSFRFCLLSLSGGSVNRNIIPMTFYTLEPLEIQEVLSILFGNKKNLKKKINELSDNHVLIPLESQDFNLFNPNTLTCPSFPRIKDARLCKKIYNICPILIEKDLVSSKIISNKWKISFKRLFDIANDSKFFLTEDKIKNELKNTPKHPKSVGNIWILDNKEEYYPLYEGRFIWHYNHRANSMAFARSGKKRKAISIKTKLNEYENPYFSSNPNYWVNLKEFVDILPEEYKYNWYIAYRAITGSTNERTFIGTIIPLTATSDNLPLILTNKSVKYICCLLANLNSIIFDYVLRLKLSSNRLSYFILEQLPVFEPEYYNEKLLNFISKRVLELTYTSYDLMNFAQDYGYQGKPFKWDSERRSILQSEIDAIFAHLYKISREELIYILNTFPVLEKKEINEYREFKSKRLILEEYDKYSMEKGLFE